LKENSTADFKKVRRIEGEMQCLLKRRHRRKRRKTQTFIWENGKIKYSMSVGVEAVDNDKFDDDRNKLKQTETTTKKKMIITATEDGGVVGESGDQGTGGIAQSQTTMSGGRISTVVLWQGVLLTGGPLVRDSTRLQQQER
jgi:hypothetical protein